MPKGWFVGRQLDWAIYVEYHRIDFPDMTVWLSFLVLCLVISVVPDCDISKGLCEADTQRKCELWSVVILASGLLQLFFTLAKVMHLHSLPSLLKGIHSVWSLAPSIFSPPYYLSAEVRWGQEEPVLILN